MVEGQFALVIPKEEMTWGIFESVSIAKKGNDSNPLIGIFDMCVSLPQKEMTAIYTHGFLIGILTCIPVS